jgi:hypothetical protein
LGSIMIDRSVEHRELAVSKSRSGQEGSRAA